MEEEFIELINQYQGILQKICNIYFYQHPFREDYYQEILIRLWKAYPQIQAGEHRFDMALQSHAEHCHRSCAERICAARLQRVIDTGICHT